MLHMNMPPDRPFRPRHRYTQKRNMIIPVLHYKSLKQEYSIIIIVWSYLYFEKSILKFIF